ncbi:MAG: DegV family protein [Velocimicrobium sp.]
MQFEIITDSSANLPEDMIETYHLTILSLSFFVDKVEYYGYEKGKLTDLAQFYAMMRKKKEITTSLVNTSAAMEQCEALLKIGKDILYIGFSSGLSGSYQSVCVALEELRERYPERKIYCVDTLAAALGEGLLVRYAIDLREDGGKIEEVYQWILDNRLRLCHWFTVDDLFFLKRGGRISVTTAVLGTALNIKPVLHVDDEGHLIMMEKARGRKKALDALVLHLQRTIEHPEGQYIYISHGDCLEDAEYVAKRVKELYPIKEVFVRVLDPVIGAHSGPGTVALFFLGSKR